MANREKEQTWISKLKALDAFPKQREEAAEFFHRSVSGGVITMVAALMMTILFFSELGLYVRVRTVNELTVDTSRGETMEIHFDVTFPKMPCSWISLDAMDVSGDIHLDVTDHNVFKQRLDSAGRVLEEHDLERHDVGPTLKSHNESSPSAAAAGNGTASPPCGSCYGAEDENRKCCNTCAEVMEAYRSRGWGLTMDNVVQCANEGYVKSIKSQQGEGCRIFGDLAINKVAGNVHIAPGRSFQQGPMHIHDLAPFNGHGPFDFTHRITKFAFGREYPGMKNPLDGVQVQQVAVNQDPSGKPTGGLFQYFLKVVPTTYITLANSSIYSNQYSVTEHYREPSSGTMNQLPGVFFFYDLSPIKVTFKEERRSFLAFLTSACAIVGGVFTVSGIVDSTIWAGQRAVRKKRELGKQF